jgi:hypothetical protein
MFKAEFDRHHNLVFLRNALTQRKNFRIAGSILAFFSLTAAGKKRVRRTLPMPSRGKAGRVSHLAATLDAG